MKKTKNNINIKNKKAYFKFEIIEKYVAGVVLEGTEIKSIRDGGVDFSDSYCYFKNGELFLRNLYISEYENGTHNNHEPKRERKLLLNKKELRKLSNNVKGVGLTIVPLRVFLTESGIAKFEIGLAKGKKNFDKRESIKNKDMKRSEDRKIKL